MCMAYKIRYGSNGPGQRSTAVGHRIGAAAVLTVLALLKRLLWQEKMTTLSVLLAGGPGTIGERAVCRMGEALAAGEGWYHALVVWCSTIIRRS